MFILCVILVLCLAGRLTSTGYTQLQNVRILSCIYISLQNLFTHLCASFLISYRRYLFVTCHFRTLTRPCGILCQEKQIVYSRYPSILLARDSSQICGFPYPSNGSSLQFPPSEFYPYPSKEFVFSPKYVFLLE